MFTLSPLNFPKIDSTSPYHVEFPASQGIYFVWDSNENPVYIGVSLDIKNRFKTRKKREKKEIDRLGSFLTWFPWEKKDNLSVPYHGYKYIIEQKKYRDMFELENFYINALKPCLNKCFKRLSSERMDKYRYNDTNRVLELIDVHIKNFPERFCKIMERTLEFMEMGYYFGTPQDDVKALGFSFFDSFLVDLEDTLRFSYKSETGQEILYNFLEDSEIFSHLRERWSVNSNVLAYKCISLAKRFPLRNQNLKIHVKGITSLNKLDYA